MSCPHLRECARLTPPSQSQNLRLEECTQCFDSQDSSGGVDICLVCFNSGCTESSRYHGKHHVDKTGHKWTLTVKRLTTEAGRGVEDNYTTTLKCWQCHPMGAPIGSTRLIRELIHNVMHPILSMHKLGVEPWRENSIPCEHILITPPKNGPRIAPGGQASCADCGLRDNLWLCLTCGNLGCGRPQFGGLGGNGHALAHYNSTKHPVNVKLGAITPKGCADVYCYECNDATEDPNLAAHLAAFGIKVKKLSKTDKTMAELQDEAKIQFDLWISSVVEPVFGAELTGLADFEHSSFMASVLQALFALPTFKTRYFNAADSKHHEKQCAIPLPAHCVECQMRKLADGLLSGRYSYPAQHLSKPHTSPSAFFQEGIGLAGLVALIGKQAPGLTMMHQRDAEEFFTYMVDLLRTDSKRFKERWKDPTAIFTFTAEQHLQCTKCSRVRYRTENSDILSLTVPGTPVGTGPNGQTVYSPVPLTSCINDFLLPESLEWICPACKETAQAVKQMKFASLPEVLVVQTTKYMLVNSAPTKLPIPVELPEDDVLRFQDGGLTVDQDADASTPENEGPQFGEAILNQFQEMGIPLTRVQKALRATGRLHAEEVLMWLFERRDDPGIDDPISTGPLNTGTGEVVYDATMVETLTSFGFTNAQVKKALRETQHNPDQAAESLFSTPNHMAQNEDGIAVGARTLTPSVPRGDTTASAQFRLLAFISHRGPSMHSGHYVVYIRRGDPREWVLFNDQRVSKADSESVNEAKKMAYMYFFARD